MAKLNLANMYIANKQLIESAGGGTDTGAKFKSGTFTSAAEQYGLSEIDCGFKPDLVIVSLPFTSGSTTNDTTSYWWKDASWAETSALWVLNPAENRTYVVTLGRETGETGIHTITDTGFKFMANGSNTRGVTCSYVAVQFPTEA